MIHVEDQRTRTRPLGARNYYVGVDALWDLDLDLERFGGVDARMNK